MEDLLGKASFTRPRAALGPQRGDRAGRREAKTPKGEKRKAERVYLDYFADLSENTLSAEVTKEPSYLSRVLDDKGKNLEPDDDLVEQEVADGQNPGAGQALLAHHGRVDTAAAARGGG